MLIFTGLQCVASGSSLWLGIISSGSVDRVIFSLPVFPTVILLQCYEMPCSDWFIDMTFDSLFLFCLTVDKFLLLSHTVTEMVVLCLRLA